MLKFVTNLDTDQKYGFQAQTSYVAMRKMIDYLNIGGKCDATIHKTESGKTLYFDHHGETYAILND